MTARECWFCFVPAMAVLCLGQAAFRPCCSRGSAHGAPLEKPGRNLSLRGALVRHPDPALQRNPWRESQGSRDVQELPWALPCASSQALFPSARRKNDGKRREMVRK